MRYLVPVAAILSLAACDRTSDTRAVGVTRQPPVETLGCVRVALQEQPVRANLQPARIGGWRLQVDVPVAPPGGWVDKGDVIHDDGVLAWLPNGAARGIEDDAADRAVLSALARCR